VDLVDNFIGRYTDLPFYFSISSDCLSAVDERYDLANHGRSFD